MSILKSKSASCTRLQIKKQRKEPFQSDKCCIDGAVFIIFIYEWTDHYLTIIYSSFVIQIMSLLFSFVLFNRQ